MVIECYLWLWIVIIGYIWLLSVIHGYGWLSFVMYIYRWLLNVVYGYNGQFNSDIEHVSSTISYDYISLLTIPLFLSYICVTTL